MYNDNAFVYWESNSRIHKLNPVFKILSLIIMFLCIFFSNSWIGLLVCSFYVFIVVIYSDISIRVIASSLNFFKLFLFLLFFVISLISLNVFLGFFVVLKFITFIMYLSVISMSSSFYDILYGVNDLFNLFSFCDNYSNICFNIALVIKFFSLLYIEDNRIRNSRMLRGVRFSDMDLVDKIDDFIRKMSYLFRNVFNRISKIKYSLYQKKYGIFDDINNYMLNKWGKTDTIMMIINVIVMVIVLIY